MRHAVGIFEVRAKAEAAVHGIGEDQVAFHLNLLGNNEDSG